MRGTGARTTLVVLVAAAAAAVTWAAIGAVLPSASAEVTGSATTAAAPAPLLDVVYRTEDGTPIALDIHPAEGAGPHPLIVWIHGGGWQSGDKSQCLPVRLGFARHGYTVACVNYRLSGEAIFPAQIEDVRDAVAFLRRYAGTYDLDPRRFAVWGSSAGGHLAALVGTTSGAQIFTPARASSVQAVIDFYGPTDLTAMVTTPGYTRHARPDSAESLLLGGPVLDDPDAARRANPITYIDGSEPPFLIVHGDADPVVPPNQSQLLYDALTAAAVPADLVFLAGARHGGPEFSEPETVELVLTFLDQHL